MSFRVTPIKNWDSLAAYARQWNALVSASADATVFQTYEWHASWWRSFGRGNELCVLLVEDQDRLIAVAPLMISKRTVKLIGSANYASDYCDFIVATSAPHATRAILNWFRENRKIWDRMDFVNFPSHSPRRVQLEQECGTFAVCSDLFCDAPTRILGNRVDDLALLNKKSIKRHFNYFQKSGELVFRHCETVEEIFGQLDAFFQQHIERRELTEDGSLFRDTKQRDFYRELVRTLFPQGWLRFSVVLFNGVPIAYHFGFEYRGRYIWYKPSFNVDFLKKSPGEVLLKYLLQHAIEKELREFDFTVGDESFKYRFSNQVRTNHRIQVFRRRWDYFVFLSVRFVRKVLRSLRTALLSGLGKSETNRYLNEAGSNG